MHMMGMPKRLNLALFFALCGGITEFLKKTMIRFLFIIWVVFMHFPICAQNLTNESTFSSNDTLKSFLVRKHPPYLYSIRLNHKEAGIGNKIARGSLYASGYNITILADLFMAPENISKWNNKNKSIDAMLKQYRKSYTSPPVIDKDLWVVNYVGHPYQGSFYYNSLRSQGATAWQSALFCTAHSVLWECGWEGGMEQPSIQDLLVTPLAGILVGELTHVATIKMSKNGFRWYEIVIVCLINPAYAINNGFKVERTRNTD